MIIYFKRKLSVDEWDVTVTVTVTEAYLTWGGL
jgi:hypothetical protein